MFLVCLCLFVCLFVCLLVCLFFPVNLIVLIWTPAGKRGLANMAKECKMIYYGLSVLDMGGGEGIAEETGNLCPRHKNASTRLLIRYRVELIFSTQMISESCNFASKHLTEDFNCFKTSF